jgi:Domain of unknown function (DUF4962)/Heparinase II/III-like protein
VEGFRTSGCVPRTNLDFIDAQLGHMRRLYPADCTAVRWTTPLFGWALPSDRDTATPWRLVVRKSTGETVVDQTSPVNRSALRAPLAVGEYEWQVSYRKTTGAMATSAVRRFSVGSHAATVSLPEGSAFAALAAAKARPRVLAAGSSYSAVQTAAQSSDHAASLQTMMNWASVWKSEAAPLPPEQQTTTPSIGTMLSTAMQERWRIETLGHAWRFSGNTAYRDAAIARVEALAKWLPSGVSSDASNDQINREIYLSLATGFDLVGDAMTPSQRQLVANAVKARIAQVTPQFTNFDAYPYQSHLATAVTMITESLLYMAGAPEFPEASAWLASSWDLFRFTLNTWGGDDGGFGNGVAYAWHEFNDLPRTLAAVKLTTGVDLHKHPFVAGLGNYLLNFTAPGSARMSAFGDDLSLTTFFAGSAPNNYRLYAALTRDPAHQWYWRTPNANLNPGYISPLNYMVLGIHATTPAPVAPSSNAYVSVDAGVAALHSKTSDVNRSTVHFRSSPFGLWNHSHGDNNAFTFDSRGQNLLISAGYYTWFRAPHHSKVHRATRYKNAMTFDGGIGQSEPVKTFGFTDPPTAPSAPIDSMDMTGSIINFYDNTQWGVVTGDATLAYRMENPWQRQAPMLSNAVRSVAMNRAERVVVIYDWATSATARRWELNFHALNTFTDLNGSLRVQNGGASACIDVYGMQSAAFAQVTGFAVAPEKPLANQAHGRFTAGMATPELASVTIIREDCRAVPISVTVTGSQAVVAINGGTAITFDRRTLKVPE